MTKEELKKIIGQLKKYDIVNSFNDKEEVDEWLSSLNSKQINNFISLDIALSEIVFPTYYLINTDLLNCEDYVDRVTALAKIKNGEGCWHLFDTLFSHNFLNSKNYYKDIEKISRAESCRYAMWVINEDLFINSPYHDEDLELIVTAKDTSGDNDDFLVAEALSMVASDKNSINSPYHREDMKLIAKSGSECLQMSSSFPDRGLNKLAISDVSLKDKYHLENMEILSKNPVSGKQLFNIMTNPNIIKGDYYRKEVELLSQAKSEITAIAMYNYIANPKDRDTLRLYDVLYDTGLDSFDIGLINRRKCISGKLDDNYLDNLELLSKVPDIYVLYIENILTNENNLKSGYQKFDIDLLLSVTDKDIFMDLFRLMIHDVSLFNEHHTKDALLISRTHNAKIRKLLLRKAMNKCSLISKNHRHDMEYIAKLDLENINNDIWDKMNYYLFTEFGIKNNNHIIALEKLYNGEMFEEDKFNVVLEYLDELEKQSEDYDTTMMVTPVNENGNKKFARIRKLFGRR